MSKQVHFPVFHPQAPCCWTDICVCVCACNPFLFSSHSHTTCASLAGLCDYVLNCVAFVSWQQSPSNDGNIYLLLAFLFCLFA